MALSRVKIWTSEVLTASDLNAEFNNILNYVNASPIIAVDGLVKATGDILQWTGTAWANKTPTQIAGSLSVAYINYISGLTLSTAGSSGTFGVATGVATDSTNVDLLVLGTAFTKTTSTWAVGTGNGSLDTGVIANSTGYHVYLIKRVDTAVVDVLVSLSATTPTMPTNYTLARRIGALRTDASAHWLSFTQVGDDFTLATSINDLNVSNIGSTATLRTLSVPSGIQVVAKVRGYMANASAGIGILITSPDETAVAANTTADTAYSQISNNPNAFELRTRTSTSAQIRVVASDNSGTTLFLATYGWVDTRGKS